ncbi:hypothetical protein Ndes2437B_g02183 [Nannochloris sp. 'desiccata']
MNNASFLLSSACAAFKNAALALNGPLERDVEASAAKCWDLRERSVQIKGRFMRTKTLIIEDPVFVDDAEHAFGDTLSNWEDLVAGGVAAAALEGKIAEQRLQHASKKVLLGNIPENLLEALNSVLTLYGDVKQLENSVSSSVEEGIFADSLQFAQQIAFQLGHGYLAAVAINSEIGPSWSHSSRPSSQAFASLASVIAHHGLSSEWTIGFLQPQLQDILPVLLSLAEEKEKKTTADSRRKGFAPEAIFRILAQLEIASPAIMSQLSAGPDAHLVPRALVDLMPIEQSSGDGGAAAAAEVCITVQKILLQLAKQASEHTNLSLAAAVSESLLDILLAASKGLSTAALHRSQEIPGTISQVAEWIFSFRPRSAVNQHLILHIVSSLPWEWLAAHCPGKLRLKWLLAAVAAVKALHEGEDRSTGEAAAAVRALSEILSSKIGWTLAIECFQGTRAGEGGGEKEDEGRMLCLLEAPPSEPPAVLLFWRQVQATVALALCTTWMRPINRERRRVGDAIKDDVVTLLEGARVPDALTQMAQSRHSTAAVSILSHVVNTTASAPDFLGTLYPTLSLTLGAALGSAEAATPTAAVVEKALSEAVQACNTDEDLFPSLSAWIGLFVGILAQQDGLSSVSASPAVLTLVAKLTRTAYSLVSEKRQLGWLLLNLANALRDQPVSQTMQLIAQLLSGDVGTGRGASGLFNELSAWLRVLGAWIADAVSLGSRLPQQGIESWSISDAEAALEAALKGEMGGSWSSSSPEEAEAAANEVFVLQDAIQSIQSTASIPALVLCYELFYRISNNYARLSPLLDQQELATYVGSLSQKFETKSPELAELLTSLLKVLEREGGAPLEAGLLLPFVGNFSAIKEVTTSVLASTWLEEDWKASFRAPLVDSLFTDFEASVSLGEGATGAAVPPTRQPLPSSSSAGSDSFLLHQQEEQAAAFAAAQEELRYWVRQGEKAAARPEGEEPSPDQGKEGDIPQPLASAQRHLWELEQRQSEELSHLHAALRQKVCQQYNPIDENFLQEASEAFSDGDRIPRAVLFRDAHHSAQCRELRKQACQVALSINSAKELSLAAKDLFIFEYLLLEAVEKGEAVQERSAIRSKLLAVMAHSLVDGSTPATAIPYMIGLFERAVTENNILLDTDAKLRLIPRIAASLNSSGPASMSGGGGGGSVPMLRGVLREKEGMRLLNACLDPDALLNAAKLREFMTALQLIVRLSQTGTASSAAAGGVGIGTGQPSAMLSSFDAQRFAVLVAEKPVAVPLRGASSTSSAGAGGSSSSAAATAAAAASLRNKSKEVSIEEVIHLAAECLAYPSSAPTGADLIEGILNLHAASLYLACLGVVLNAPATGRRDTMLSMLSQVPMEMLEPPVLAEALSMLTQSLYSGKIDPPDLPYGLLGDLLRAVPVLESLRTNMNTSIGSTAVKLESYTMKKSAWTISIHASGSVPTSITLQPISASYTPLGTLAENALQAAIHAVLRTLRSSSNTDSSSSDLAQPFFGIIFELAGVCGLEWLWIFYQTHLCSFIADADKAISSTACASAFQQFWALLPWNQQATFHLESPVELAKIRTYLPSADYAAARLVHDLDWTPLVTAFLPAAPTGGGRGGATARAGRSGSAAVAAGGNAGGVFTLLDETEDDNALIAPSAISSTRQQESNTGNIPPCTRIDLTRYPRKQWAAELGLLLLHCSVFLPDSPIGIPEWVQKLLLERAGAAVPLNRDPTNLLDTSGETGGTAVEENGEGLVEIIRLLAGADWHLIESILLLSFSSSSSSSSEHVTSSANSGVYGKAPWLVLPLLLAPQSIYGEVGERVVHAAYVLGRAAEKEGSATAARVVAKVVRPLLAFSICQGIQISTDQQMQVLGGGGGGGGRAVQEAATAAALAASIASHQLVDIPADIPEELLEGTVELEQLRLQREQIRIAQEEISAAAAATPTPSQSVVPATGSAAPLIEVSGCFRFTPAQHVTLLRDVLGPLAAKHAQQPMNISSIVAEQCTPGLEPPSENSDEAVLIWDSPSLAAFTTTWQTEEEQHTSTKDQEEPAAVVAILCVSLLQPLVLDPLTILTQDQLSYSNADLPWVMENTSKAVFISNVFGSSNINSSGGGGGAGQQHNGATRQRPGGRSMRALRQQISSLLRRRDATTTCSYTNGQDSFSLMNDPDMALNQAVTDALSLRNLMGHVIEDAAVRAVYSVQHEKRLGACLLRCIILTPSVYHSVFVAHVAENILRGLASPSPSAIVNGSTGGTTRYKEQVHAAEEVPVVEAAVENTGTARTGGAPVSTIVSVPDSMHFAAAATSNLEPSYLLQFSQAAARMRRPLLTTYALASARHAATLLDKIAWQALVIEALKVIQQSESNAEHPLDVVAPWLESLKWIGDTRWRRLPSGPHKVALNDLLSSLDNRVQMIEVLTPEELDGKVQRQQERSERRNPLLGVASAARAAAGRARQQQLAHSSISITSREDDGVIPHGDERTINVPAGVPSSISEFEPVQLSSAELPPSTSPASSASSSLAPPEEDPSLSKKFASGFRNFGKSVSQASSKLKNKLADGEKTALLTTTSCGGGASGSAAGDSSTYPATATTPTLPSPSKLKDFPSINPESDHLVRVGLAAYAITSYIRSVMDPKLTRRTISGAEPSSPKHPGAPSSAFTTTASTISSSVHIRGNSSLTGSRHLEEAQISELDTVLEAREAVDYLLELEASPLLAQHRHVYAGFLDGVPQLLTARTGVQTFVVAVVKLLVPNEVEAGQLVALLTHSGA